MLYLWNLSASGFANTFYAAAAQAGSQSWRAWFFGSLDAANFITVDKPPASLWVTGLSMRVFGVNSWAALAPQALMGVAAVGLLYATMRRTFSDPTQGTVAGLIAGAVLAFTPAAALMFRFNNPDALLVLLMTAAAYCLVRAISANSGRWLALVGAAWRRGAWRLSSTARLEPLPKFWRYGFWAVYLVYGFLYVSNAMAPVPTSRY